MSSPVKITDNGGNGVTVTNNKLDVNASVSLSGTTDVNLIEIGGNALTTTLPVSGTLTGVTTVATVTNLAQQGGVAISLNTGVRDTGTQRVTIATNDVVPVSQSGTWDEVGINDSGNSITVDYATTGSGTATGALRVELPTNGTGVLATVGTVTTCSTVTTVSTLTGGGIAHDSADSGNPIKVGGKAFSPDGTTPGAVAENDRSDLKTDLNGRLFVNNRSAQSLHKHLDGTTAYTDESIIADPGDGFQAVITGITFSSGEAVAINFFLEEGSTKIFGPIYIEAVAGRGFTAQGMYLPCTASTAVTLTTSAANDQSFDLDYFIQAV